MLNYKFSLFCLFSLFSFITVADNIKYFKAAECVEYDSIPYMVYDSVFESSFMELERMFHGKETYDLKRAEFLIENSYYGNNIEYQEYCHDIDSIVRILNSFIDLNNIRQYKTAPNYALFEFFTKPSIINGNHKFTYDFENPMGESDFTVMFTSKLLKTHKGQCTSLPLLYKILCDELGGQCALAIGPMHLYIKHIGEDGRWVNVELTSGCFVRDIWLMETMNVSTEAIRNGIFLCALSEKETIAFMMLHLAKTYINKYKSYDFFVERAINSVLLDLPNFCDALVLKLNLVQNQGLQFQNKYGNNNSLYLQKLYNSYQEILSKLDMLGYTQPTVEEYNNNIKEGQQNVDRLKE